MAESRPPVSDAERDVLEVLWALGPCGVRGVHARLIDTGLDWSRWTVITLLQRLERKGCVAADKTGFAFTYEAAVTRDDLADERLRELADELYEGQAGPLLLAFARRQRFTQNELEELRQLIDELDGNSRKQGKRL